MLIPTPSRLLKLAVMCGATVGFFKYFRIEGLDQLYLAPRESMQVGTGGEEGFFAGAYPQSSNPSAVAPFPSTALHDSPQAWQSNQHNPNPWNVQAKPPSSTDLWANDQAPAQVRSAKFASTPPTSHSLVNYASKLTLGSFNMDSLDLDKIKNPFIADRIAQIIGDFSCIALQSVDMSNPQMMPELLRMVNAQGRHYEFIEDGVMAKPGNRGLVIVFDADQLEVDRHQTYTLRDESDSLSCRPLVAWFRAKQMAPDKAFTFTFVNSHLAMTELGNECRFIPDMIATLVADGRNEDDIIIASSSTVDSSLLESLNKEGCRVLPAQPLLMSQEGEAGFVFVSSTCREHLGESGSFNILRRYNLTPQEASAISRFAPVWAEFDVAESTLY